MIRSLITVCAVVGLLVLTGIAIAAEIKGTVTKVSQTDKTLTVKPETGDEVKLKWNDETKFVGGKGGTKDLKSEAVKEGSKVTATYEKDLASKILIMGKK